MIGGGIFADDLAIGSDNLETMIERCTFIDHIVLGEGEILFQKLVEGELDKRVISIADLDGKTLEISQVPVPDFSDFDLESYYHLTIEGGRSCPFQCSFCSETTQWGTYRVKARDLLASQLDQLSRRYGNNTFFMGDSLMNPYILGFSKELVARGIDVLYDGYLRADKMAADWERAKIWASSGVYRVRLGIESASAEVLKSMVKLTTPEVIAKALKALSNAGIRTTTYWIVGFPGETEQNFEETLDFIRENHRYIYELECHPYYYYPYGQVGSRFQESFSLYPSEVTDVIRFKIWDIVDSNPPRQVKYDRLRRLSALASELGLPNIYTMPDRYYAEERWQRLHPSAREVYEATHRSRALPAPTPNAAAWPRSSASTPLLAYRLDVDGELDGEVLSAALARLIEHNDVLLADLEPGAEDGGSAALAPAAPAVLELAGDADDEAFLSAAAERLAAGLAPLRGASVALARVRAADRPQALLLAVHPRIADGKSLVAFAEDLFRLYRQIEEGRRITLEPRGRGFLEWAAEPVRPAALYDGLAVLPRIRRSSVPPEGMEIAARSEGERAARLALPPALTARIFSDALHECGLKPAELLALAWREAAGAPVDALVDRRSADPGLAGAVGPLAAVAPLPAEPVPAESSSPRRWKERLRALAAPETDGAPEGAGRVLFNGELFVEEPWVENDLWRPAGFVAPLAGPRAGYALEVLPLLRRGGIEIALRFAAAPVPGEPERLAAALGAALERLLARAGRWAAARRYCRLELAGGAAVARLTGEPQAGAWRTLSLAVDAGAVERLAAASGQPAGRVLLAVWSALLSRLGGSEDIVLLADVDMDEGHGMVPLRLRPSWAATGLDWLREVGRKAAGTATLAADALEILASETLSGPEGAPVPSFESGFRYAESGGAAGVSPALEDGLAFWLDVRDRAAGLSATLRYRAAGEELARAAASTWEPFLAELAAAPETPLEQVLENRGESARVRDLAAETFAF